MEDKRDIFSKMSVRERIITVAAGVLIIALTVVAVIQYITILKTQETINQILDNQTSVTNNEKIVWVNPETTVDVSDETNQSITSTANTTEYGETVEYVINKNSKKIHSPDCESAIKTKDSNKETVNWTEEEYLKALDDGYSPCSICGAGR